MDKSISLDVEPRNIRGKKVKTLRRQGIIPATVYGKDIEPMTVQLRERAFGAVYQQVGRSALVELRTPGQPVRAAFIQDVQRHPISRNILHADLHVVNLREKMNVEVPITLVGNSPLLERGDAVVNHMLHTVEVMALPADVPQHIEVDVSILDSLDSTISVQDLPGSDKYSIVTGGDKVIVALTATRAAIAAEGEEVEGAPAAEPELIREERGEEEQEQTGAEEE